VLKDDLKELQRKQAHEVESLALAKQEVDGLAGLIQQSTIALGAINDSFRAKRRSAGSWIKGQSLIVQLIRQRPLTVDLTPDDLRQPRPFGIPFQSLKRLVNNNLIYLNLRNFDSDPDLSAHDDQTQLPSSPTESVASRLEELMSYRGAVYIGSSVRRSIFNAALIKNGYNLSYESYQQHALTDLSAAHECYQAVAKIEPGYLENLEGTGDFLNANFRGDRPNLSAATWHWAFLSAVSHYIEDPFLIRLDSTDTVLGRLYKEAVEYGDTARHDQSPMNDKKRAAIAFAKLAGYLRTCHLNYTAPITASWGATYNLSQGEYAAAATLVERGEKRFSDQLLNEFLAYVFFEQDARLYRLTHYIHSLEHVSETDKDNFHLNAQVNDVMFDDDSIKALIDALINNDQDLDAATRALAVLADQYADGNRFTLRNLLAMLDDYREARRKANNKLLKFLQNESSWNRIWNYIILPPIAGAMVVGGPLAPWIMEMLADEFRAKDFIPNYVFNRVFREPRHRAMYQVYTTLRKT